ncbi:hypothetical protein ACGFZQ_15285 [Streptomyces sp. NPDC048254]|uniref:hypothetical protein n=1 Tax=Streptomyces sp. NPDC048254 TaxID=3365525 RepID=UPI003723A4BD
MSPHLRGKNLAPPSWCCPAPRLENFVPTTVTEILPAVLTGFPSIVDALAS